jgi:uncharacterized membrane protein
MRVINWVVGAIAGILVTTMLAGQALVWPNFAIGAGAVTTAGILLFLRRSGRKYYAAAGTAYCLGLATLIYTTSVFSEGYAESPFAVLLSLGLVSALIVALQIAAQRGFEWIVGDRIGSDEASAIFQAITAVLGLLGMIWTVLTAYEKALRYGGITIGGTLGFALNALGIELPIPWIISSGVDASVVAFVGAVLIGFHTLESLHSTWHATKVTAKAGAKAGQSVGERAADAATSARSDSDE